MKQYLIWSIEHEAWWMPNRRGYTRSRKEAGKYNEEDALSIVKNANIYSTDIPNEAMIEEELNN